MAVTTIAHRGAPWVARENTLASFRAAIAAGADVVELDVRATQDGVPVVLHDATLKRLWGRDQPVGRLTAAEVRRLTDNGVPLLPEALAVTFPVRTLIDLPSPSAETAWAVVSVVRDNGALGRVTYCGDPAALRAVRAVEPTADIALTWKRPGFPRASLLADVRPGWLNYRFGVLTPALVRQAHLAGYLVSAWTVDSRRQMRRLLAMGVDGLTSNQIGLLCEVTAQERARSSRE